MAARVVAEKAGDLDAGTVHADLMGSAVIAKVEMLMLLLLDLMVIQLLFNI